jgi:hypothetical protein
MVSRAVVRREDGEVIETLPATPPRITPEVIAYTKQSIALLQGMVKDLLISGIDYGRIKGTPQDSLWDPGASTIIGAFNCYPGRREVLRLEDNDQKIVFVVEVPLISRTTQQQVGSGIGAASTMETKYKYRWVANPKEWGYDEEVIKTFKKKPGRDEWGANCTVYRIPNPEHSELLNTIVKIASKRAEVDAAEALPGVASVLRQIFTGYKPKEEKGGGQGDYDGARWQWFWGQVRSLGFTPEEAHAKLTVASMKDWVASGRTMDAALEILRGKDEASQQAQAAPGPDQEEPGDLSPPDNRSIMWENIQSLLKQLKGRLKPDAATAWLNRAFSIVVEPGDLEAAAPPEKLSDKMLESFMNTLLDFETKRPTPKAS